MNSTKTESNVKIFNRHTVFFLIKDNFYMFFTMGNSTYNLGKDAPWDLFFLERLVREWS